MYEEIPYWLAAISPLMYQHIVFVQYVAVKEIFDLSAQAEAFVTAYLKQWLLDKVGFRVISLPKLDLVLVSGS